MLPALCRPGPQIFLMPARITRPVPRMYSSSPRISNDTWCTEVCGPFAMARLWCQSLHRMKCIISPMCSLQSVSESLKPSTWVYQSRVALGSLVFMTACEMRTGIASPSSIARCWRTATSDETSMVRPSRSKKRKP